MKIPNYDTKSPTQGRSLCNSWMKIFACLSPAKVAAEKPIQLCTSCENLLFTTTKFTFSPQSAPGQIVDLQKVMKPISKKSRGTKFLNCIPRRKSWTHQNTQATTEKSLFLMTLLMHLIEFNQKLQTIGQMEGITEFLPFIFRNLITMFRRRSG